MDTTQKLTAQIDAMIKPRSVAIVGVPREMKTGKLYLISLLEQQFPGPIYPVNPKADEIDGLKCYPDVSSIPGSVDLAIVLVPIQYTLSVIHECVAKGVKGVVLFTAGYKETGSEEGRALEEEIVRVAGAAGMRLIGPNGMGIYAPKSGLSFLPGLTRKSGPVGIISHSGSIANTLATVGPNHGVFFSKSLSLGNECDLTSADFLAYLGNDPDTKVIGAYLENIKDGRVFLQALTEASRQKPVILWKIGLTPEGSRAAASHTGAMAGNSDVWSSVVKQSGAIPVVGFENWLDYLMGFTLLPDDLGDRMAIISGPGGFAVSAAEACGREGLKLAELTGETKRELARFVPPSGTSLHNPIDVGMSASLVIDIYVQSARLVAADPDVDAVAIAGIGMSPETNLIYTEAMIQAQKDFNKPFIMIKIPGFQPELAEKLCQAGLPFFQSAERAMLAYAQVLRFQHRRRESKV